MNKDQEIATAPKTHKLTESPSQKKKETSREENYKDQCDCTKNLG